MPVATGLQQRNQLESDDTDNPPKRDSKSGSPFALAGIIEGQIIPQLLCAHRDDGRAGADARRDRIPTSQSDGFAAMVLRLEAHALMEQVEGFLARGASVESVLVDLLAPAARQLGTWWEVDSCDFVDVTMGLWRLQQLVYELSARLPGKAPRADRSRNALFSVVPGSQHSFGTVVIDEVFRRQGWSTTCLTSTTEAQLLKLAASTAFDLVGLTVTHDDECAPTAALISRLRTTARNPELTVMVGGRLLSRSPELALQMGADATAVDAESAVARAEIMLQARDGLAIGCC